MHRATCTAPPPILLLIVLAPFPFFLRIFQSERAWNLQVDPLFCRCGGGIDELALPAGRSRAPEMLVRFPRRALAGRDFFHHLVDLLESEASSLGHEEVGPEDTAAAQPAPDEEHFGAKVAVAWVDHIRDDNACDGVITELTDANFDESYR